MALDLTLESEVFLVQGTEIIKGVCVQEVKTVYKFSFPDGSGVREFLNQDGLFATLEEAVASVKSILDEEVSNKKASLDALISE